MLNNISIIAFDLDDTLWPCMPVIERAEAMLYQWLQQYFPDITDAYSAADMSEMRRHMISQDERLKVDLSLMRYEFLKQLAIEANYDPDLVSQSGFDVFYQARQQVEFFDDVLPCLQRLGLRYRLGVISNGNACVEKVGLGHLIEHAVSAAMAKAAKPDGLIYASLVEYFDVPAEQVLYVGDHPDYDVVGSEEAGLKAVWLNRNQKPWPQHLPEPSYQVSSLYELEDLLSV